MSPLRRAELAWAKRVYGSRWRRAFARRRGNGSLMFGVAAFRAGWWSGFGSARMEQATRVARRGAQR